MKTLFSFFLLLSNLVLQGQNANLTTFSGEKNFVDVQYSGKLFNQEATDAVIMANKPNRPKPGDLAAVKAYLVYKLGLQRALDDNKTGAELLWEAEGDLGQIYQMLQNTNSSWIWSQAQPGEVSLTITLNLDGSGYIDLFQEKNLVGHIRCHSSNLRNQEGGQPNPGPTTIWQTNADYVNSHKVKMPNALFIDKPNRLLAIHAGGLAPTGGCVRIGSASARVLFDLMKKGSKVEVVWNTTN